MSEKDPQEIIEKIIDLANELAEMVGSGGTRERSLKKTKKKVSVSAKKGAMGAIEMLINEGYFDKLKDLNAVMERLKEIGHYHKTSTVSMNLLNLTRGRVLNRFKNTETKKWEYVIRR